MHDAHMHCHSIRHTAGTDRNIRGKKAVWFSDIFHTVFFLLRLYDQCTHTYTQPDAVGRCRTHEAHAPIRNCTATYTEMHIRLYASRIIRHNVRHAIRYAWSGSRYIRNFAHTPIRSVQYI